MKNIIALGLLTTLAAHADPAVRNVQVNIHNGSAHTIEFVSFDSNRIFANTRFAESSIPPNTSTENAIYFSSFDQDAIAAGVNVLINDEPMKLMWQVNMGYDDPDAPKFHICGVIKDNGGPKHEYCDMPYVVGDTLMVDFNIE